MDDKFLERANSALKQLKTKLLLNEKIRTWLYYDTINEDIIVPSIETVKSHIFIQPIVDTDVTEPFNKKNYITITLPEGNLSDNSMEYVVRFIVMCDKTSWMLNDDIRPLLISQQIINDIDNFKVVFSNTLKFDSIVETVTNKNVTGYSILFNVLDGISD